MSDWRDRVDDLLYDGETVTESVDVGPGRLVVTTHRVLAFTPEGDGANFRAVDRPNVEGVSATAGGNGRYLRWTLRPLLLGALLLAVGSQLNVGDPLSGVDTGGAEGTGTGGILSTVSSITSLLAVVDEVMVAVGAVCLLVVALLLALYLYSRERTLVVAVAGDDDLELPVEGDHGETASRLEAALSRRDGPESDGVDAGATAETGDSAASTRDGVDEPRTVDDVLSAAGSDRSADSLDPTVPVEPDPSAPPADDGGATSDRRDEGDEGK